MAKAPASIAAIARSEYTRTKDERRPVVTETNRFEESTVPYVIDSLFVVDLEVDYNQLIESLRKKTDLNQVAVRDATVVFCDEGDDLNVWQLAPLAGTLLHLCDGRRTVAEITHEFSLLDFELNEIPVDKVCLFGLMQLLEDGFIGLSAAPLAYEDESNLTAASSFSLPPKARNTQQPWPLSQGKS
jgi:hypothetical protein